MRIQIFKNYLIYFPDYIFLLAYSCFIVIASPILKDMSVYFNVTPENMNLITTFFMIGQISGFLTLFFLNMKFNKINVNVWTYILLIPTLIGLILTTSLFFFYLLYFISGFLFGIAFININISLMGGEIKNTDSVMNIGWGFCSIGALVSSLFSPILVSKGINWKLIYLIVISLIIICFISYLLKNKRKLVKINLSKEKKIIFIKELFKNRNKNLYFILTIILIGFDALANITITSWGPTFFRIEKMFDVINAGFIMFLYLIGILIGRLLLSFLSYKFKTTTLLIALPIINIVGLILLIFPIIRKINFVGALITGLGVSGIVPLLISSVGKIFQSRKDIAFIIFFTSSATSCGLAPFIIRFIANYSIFVSMVITIIFMVFFVIFVIIWKYYKKSQKYLEI